jgi:hypothetical protein
MVLPRSVVRALRIISGIAIKVVSILGFPALAQ